MAWFFPPVCVVCGREGAWLCPPARAQIERESLVTTMVIPGVDAVWARGSYDCPPLQALIQRMKYSGWHGLDEEFQIILQPLATALERLPPNTRVVPVPLHGRRLRGRGFNQAGSVAAALAGLTGWPIADCLRRARATKSQAQLPARARQTNVAGAFVFAGRGRAAKNIVLVDDVITTGATMQACAEILRQHGVQHITAIALAKG